MACFTLSANSLLQDSDTFFAGRSAQFRTSRFLFLLAREKEFWLEDA